MLLASAEAIRVLSAILSAVGASGSSARAFRRSKGNKGVPRGGFGLIVAILVCPTHYTRRFEPKQV